MREIDEVFECELRDLSSSLKIFNDEYGLFSNHQLKEEIKKISEMITNLKITHASKYNERFNRELNLLEEQMCNFFYNKLIKKNGTKDKLGAKKRSNI